jgi:hypothetical protein
VVPALGTGAVAHSFLLDWGLTGGGGANHRAMTTLGQDDAANFLSALTAPPPIEAR